MHRNKITLYLAKKEKPTQQYGKLASKKIQKLFPF